MTIIDDYLDYQIQYSEKYGKDTCVLMQVGHFFEAYAVDNEKEKTNSENMYRLAEVMNIQMTRKNKSILENSRGNPLMIGVNIYSIDKYIQLLLNRNYTIVLIEQVTEPPEPERKVTQIYSPSTAISHYNKSDSNYCVCLYIESVSRMNSNKKIMNIGLSCIELSTGRSKLFEVFSKHDDENYALDETFRFIQSWNPKEVIVVLNNYEGSQKQLCAYLELTNRTVHFYNIENKYEKIEYQKQFFEKIYGSSHGLLSIHEYLDLERIQWATISFIYLLEFAYSHNENILKKIEKPEIIDSVNHLILTNNSINQLNLVSNQFANHHTQFNSLLSVVDSTKTSIGKRTLKSLLLNPINDIEELNKRYEIVQSLHSRDINKQISQLLAPIVDIERIHRKITLKYIQPSDFVGLMLSYSKIKSLVIMCKSINELESIVPSNESVSIFETFNQYILNNLDMDIIGKYHLDKINHTIFQKGIYPKIDVMQDKIDSFYKNLNDTANTLSAKMDDNTQMVKLESNDRDGFFLSITAKRADILKKKFKNMSGHSFKINDSITVNPSDFEFKNINKTQTRITSNDIRIMSQSIRKYEHDIGNLVRDAFNEFLEYIDKNFVDKLKTYIDFIGNLDTYNSVANVSMKYGYHRPTIIPREHSFCNITGIRHPIIERLDEDHQYVTNDISLGSEDTMDGMLLYGTNAAGKSSLMKAVGCNIIMAQAGFFVAAEKMEYSPYQYLFTRINNNDNIFKGESSFAVEMSELRNILKRCNTNSLILGDELCSGTESISALSIFAASVKKLSKMKSSFIFATHLHELSRMNCVTELNNVKMFHLKVIYDENQGKLIYDRKLTEGSGNSIYGLEVCKSMDMDRDFLEDANAIRQEIMNIKESILEYKTSKYNSNLIVDKCKICNADAEDTHHIKFQCTANENDVIDGHIQKDSKSNLVPLCKMCHENVHKNLIVIDGYIKTSEGSELKYHKVDTSERKANKKYSDEHIHIIQNVCENNCKLNLKSLALILNEKHNINISTSTLSKIKKGAY
jgi:DNA mismatch repair protein MutS